MSTPRPVIKDLRVNARIHIVLTELRDQGDLDGRPGRDGTQRKIIEELPTMIVESEEFTQRLEDAGKVLQYGYRLDTDIPPRVITEDASDITDESATIWANMNTCGSNATTGFEYGTTKALGAVAVVGDPSPLNSNEWDDVHYDVSGLSPSTKYYYRAFCQTIGGALLQYGAIKSFVTLPEEDGPPS
jgi:hypothetical protein